MILIIDDSPDDSVHARVILEKAGYSVVTAANSHEALSSMNSYHPNLVILDLVMPETDGISLFSHIKTLNPTIKAILCTASRQESIVHLAMISGLDGVLTKPYEDDTLIRMVKTSLGGE